MKHVTCRKVTCRWCGQTREVRVVDDDGMDWEGHARGNSEHEEYDDGCTCTLGVVEHTGVSLARVKPMCMNCKFNKDGSCTNEKTRKKLTTMFSFNELIIADETMICNEYEFDPTDVIKMIQINEEEKMPKEKRRSIF